MQKIFFLVAKKQSAFYLCLFFLFTHINSLAQPHFTAKANQEKIGLHQHVEIVFEIVDGTKIEDLRVPPFSGFDILSGPMESSFSSNINGQISSRKSFSFFLKPKQVGKVHIDGARAKINGQEMISNPVTIEVQEKDVDISQSGTVDPFGNMVPQVQIQQQIPTSDPQDLAFEEARILRPGENMGQKINKNLFLKVTTNKNTVYEGEPIVATYKLYSRLDMTNGGVTKRPTFSGFSAIDMEEPNQNGMPEKLNGQMFLVYTIRKVQLYPLQSGQLTLEPVEAECDVRFVKTEHIHDADWNQNDTANQLQTHCTVKSQAIVINTLPLPIANKPANFKGAVGDFNIQAQVVEPETGKGDANKLMVEISGKGNFSMVQQPTIAWPDSMEAFDPKQKEQLDNGVSPTIGNKFFEYVFVPHKAGKDSIPPISFSYFDPISKTYKTVSTKPILISVAPQSLHPQKINATDTNENLPGDFIEIAKYVLPIVAGLLLLVLGFSFMGKKKKRREAVEQKAMHDAWERMVNETDYTKEKATENDIQTNTLESHQTYIPAALQQEKPVEKTIEIIHPKLSYDYAIFPEAANILWQGNDAEFFQTFKKELEIYVASKKINEENLEQKNALIEIKNIIQMCNAVAYSPLVTPPNRNEILDTAKDLLGKM